MRWCAGASRLDGVAYFQAADGVHGAELRRSDGTARGTDMAGTASSSPSPVASSRKYVFIQADEPSTGPWTTESAPDGKREGGTP